jgi:arginase family enzyme
MDRKKGWDNAFTATELLGTVKGSPSFAGALSFMRRKYTRDLAGVDVAVTGIPLDLATTNRPGARFGPRAIRAATPGISWSRPWPWDFDPFDHMGKAALSYIEKRKSEEINHTIDPLFTDHNRY